MFNFKGQDQQKRIGDLSGGEMNRLHLARTLKKGGNVLLLDEPTNDPRRRHAAGARGGARRLRRLRGRHQPRPRGSSTASRRTCSRSRARARQVWFEGNYQEYEEDRKRRLGMEADQPHRIKYKKLAVG
jgi:ATPase subunit of ABC transporter with duplicated ATPase domains